MVTWLLVLAASPFLPPLAMVVCVVPRMALARVRTIPSKPLFLRRALTVLYTLPITLRLLTLLYVVTSVGATIGINPEIAVNFTSGGFSNYFAQPSHQFDATASYLATLPTDFKGKYNKTGRGYPDVRVCCCPSGSG
jgi:hypothetical protein